MPDDDLTFYTRRSYDSGVAASDDLRAAVGRLLGYEPKCTLEGMRAAAVDLDSRGFAEAAAQVGRCARELGYAGEPATLAVAVGDACLAFARELHEIHARHMAVVRRLESEIAALRGEVQT